jgi:hypothetical protein
MSLQIVDGRLSRVEERILIRIIKQRILAKLGRSIVGPAFPRLAVDGTSESRGLKERRSPVRCVSCGCEISLDQGMFAYYSGPPKCFSCSAMLEIKMETRILESTLQSESFLDPPVEKSCHGSVSSQESKSNINR